MRIGLTLLLATAALSLAGAHVASADARPPYTGMPRPGDAVRLDATVGGQKAAWAYVDRQWLERYLQVTIDAAGAGKPYDDSEVQNQLSAIAKHVTPVPNGTRAAVEEVADFQYGGRADTEVRVMVAEGPMKGRELWTTCAELVDSAGHPFVRV